MISQYLCESSGYKNITFKQAGSFLNEKQGEKFHLLLSDCQMNPK